MSKSVAIITGGSQGIGRATAIRLARDFSSVVVVARDRTKLESTAAAVKEAGATLLHIHLHTFSDGGGVSGVAVLAESHISVHTWPEKGYAAFDVFMCGDAQPRKALDVFKAAFNPGRMVLGEHKRGVL